MADFPVDPLVANLGLTANTPIVVNSGFAELAAFIEELFPEKYSFGATGGAMFNTSVVVTSSGRERRNINWAKRRGRWEVSHNIKYLNEFEDINAFFHIVQGMGVGFRFTDHADFAGTLQSIGLGDGSTRTFQLVKQYTFGGSTYIRDITKPKTGTVTIFFDGIPEIGSWSVDTTSGIVTFNTPPGAGVVIAATYEFHVPARFDTDELRATIEDYQVFTISSIPIIEVRHP